MELSHFLHKWYHFVASAIWKIRFPQAHANEVTKWKFTYQGRLASTVGLQVVATAAGKNLQLGKF